MRAAAPTSDSALLLEILALQARGLDSLDIALTIVANELHQRGWLIVEIAPELHIPVDRVLTLLGLAL